MSPLSLHDGSRLVRAARAAIELSLISPEFKHSMVKGQIADIKGAYGVFVSVEHYPTNTLRGCMGSVDGSAPLADSVISHAIAAASNDPHFVPVSHLEFEHIVVSVSVVSDKEPIKAKSEEGIKRSIGLGREGVYLIYGYHNSTLLPEAPLANGWSKEKTLDELCLIAGLKEHVWKTGSARLYTFTTQRFKETSPHGPVEEIRTE